MLLRRNTTVESGHHAGRFFITTGALGMAHSLGILAIYGASPPSPYAWVALSVGVATLGVGLVTRRWSRGAVGRMLGALWLAWIGQMAVAAHYALAHPPAETDIASLTPSPLARAALLLVLGATASGYLFRTLWHSLQCERGA